MITYFLRKWASKMTPRHIPDRDNPDEIYLSRYFTTEKQEDAWWFLHNIKLPDYEPSPHNHPYDWQLALILWNSYTEQTFDPKTGVTTTKRRRWFNWIPGDKFHNITELHGDVWTIFIHGPKHGKSWGFWVPGFGYCHNQRLAQVKHMLDKEHWTEQFRKAGAVYVH